MVLAPLLVVEWLHEQGKSQLQDIACRNILGEWVWLDPSQIAAAGTRRYVHPSNNTINTCQHMPTYYYMFDPL